MLFALLNASLPSAVPLVSVNSKDSWIGATLQARVWTQVQHSDWWAAAARLYSRRPKHFLNLASAPSMMPTNCASRKSVSANTTIVENALFHPSSLAKLSTSGYLDQQCGNHLRCPSWRNSFSSQSKRPLAYRRGSTVGYVFGPVIFTVYGRNYASARRAAYSLRTRRDTTLIAAKLTWGTCYGPSRPTTSVVTPSQEIYETAQASCVFKRFCGMILQDLSSF